MPSPAPLLAVLLLASVLPAHGEEMKPFQFKELRLSLPSSWINAAHGRVVPTAPLYNKEDAALYLKDPQNQLKPGYENMPQHLEVRFGPLPEFPVKDHAFKPEITVHPVADFLKIYEPEKNATQNMRKAFDDLWAAVSKPAKVKDGKPLPFIPFLDAEQGVTVCAKPVNFAGGRGFRLVTQFDIEASLLSEHGLVYVFEGMTDDRKTYVLATFPVRLDGLLKTGEGEHLGYSTQNYAKLEKESTTYRQKAAVWLTKNQDEITPELKRLDDIVASIVVVPRS